MRKKIICTILVAMLVATSFAGCGKNQDTNAVDVAASETEKETGDPHLTAEAQADVDTLLPAETQKPVVTEPEIQTSKPVETKAPEATATPKPTETATATATPKPTTTATTTSKPVTTAVAANTTSTGKTGTSATEAPKEAPSATMAPTASTPAPASAPCNHNYVKEYWPSAPTCNSSGDWTMICSICGEAGASGTDPELPHTPATKIEVDATYCNEHGIIVTYCTSCGNELGRDGFDGTEHEWVTGLSDPIWDEEKEDFVAEEVTYCSRCHAQR